MKRKRHTPEQIVHKLREADRLKSEGHTLTQVCQRLEISEQTYHRWRNEYGGSGVKEVHRLKDMEKENARHWPHKKKDPRPSRPKIRNATPAHI